MKLTPKNSLFCVLFLSVSAVYAQEPLPKLKGKVTRVNPTERTSEIKISVIDKDTNKLVEGEQLSTHVEDWYHVVRPSMLVDVKFDGGKCYEWDGHSNIRVRKVNQDLPIVILQKTVECKIAEMLHDKRKKKKLYSTIGRAADSDTGGAASGESKSNMAIAEFGTEYSSEIDWIPSPEVLRQKLEAEAAHARSGEFFDTFQYKFALKVELYHDRPELIKVLNDFRTSKENAVFFQAIGKLTPEMFRDVVRREFQLSPDANLNNVFAVVKEDNASQNTRGSANVALVNGPLPEDMKKEVLEYYRRQTPSSPIFLTSLVALQSIGEAEDKAKLDSYILDSSGEPRVLAMRALFLSTLIEGPTALPGGSKSLATVANSGADPAVRAFAFHSLRPFLYSSDEIAVKTLLDNLTDPNDQVRLQVVLALGVGKTEQSRTVKNRLLRISLRDPSPEVREAARLSLSGASTTALAATTLTMAASN